MRRALFIFACILTITSIVGQESFNVMSFNIRYPNPGDGIHYWDNRRPHVASLIQFHEADLIGVQEAFRRQLDEMVTDMPEYDWFGVCRTDGTINPSPENEFSAILFRKDRFERLDGNTFWLSGSPEATASVGWDAALPRIVTWSKFKDKKSGKEFFHFNTHFDHMGGVARNESAKLLLQKIKTIAGDMPVIITGDFNCGEIDQPYLTITMGSDFSDAMKISKTPHHGPTASFAGNFQVSGLNDHRIDFIFANKHIDVLKHGILSDSWNGSFASDHLPVLAKIVIVEH
jgi:endonuclease/exonuclease/phosphatase family metal-dependent hydrolase